MRQGAEGCLVADPRRRVVHLPAPRVAAVDSNGAGDTHVGTFLAGLFAALDPVDRPRRERGGAAFVSRAR